MKPNLPHHCSETGPVCANPVYDAWYALWTPVIQPALGILMASVSTLNPPP